MARPRTHSTQTRLVLEALVAEGGGWRYGYDLSRRTGLASGTLYPILRRLAKQGLLESQWEHDAPEGRPRRHLHRLTGTGVAAARAAQASKAPIGGAAWSA